jgi:3-methyladenine DNA glycosylase AlkD
LALHFGSSDRKISVMPVKSNKLTDQINSEIKSLSEPSKIPFYTHFFRADPGDICYGDKFLAIKVPAIRKLIKKYYNDLELADLESFLDSPYNEIRFFGQQIVREKFLKARSLDEKKVYVDYLSLHIASINHWNLVDTVSDVFGKYCLEIGDFTMLERFSVDLSIWIRRIGIVSCLSLVKTKHYNYTPLVLNIITSNIGQTHEYIHKAMGWILREIGKYDEKVLIDYLQDHWIELAPVTRSYATEKLRLTRDTKAMFGGNTNR